MWRHNRKWGVRILPCFILTDMRHLIVQIVIFYNFVDFLRREAFPLASSFLYAVKQVLRALQMHTRKKNRHMKRQQKAIRLLCTSQKRLKVVTNEKQGGPGSWQMIDIGPRPW
jgi:hypothetical protein